MFDGCKFNDNIYFIQIFVVFFRKDAEKDHELLESA